MSRDTIKPLRRCAAFLPLVLLGTLEVGCATRQPGDPIRPGFNVYGKEQDIQLGQQAAAEIRKQVDIVNNRELQSYVAELGRRLATQPGADDYPYSFTLINDDSINAFALPGGPVFLHSGLLEAADNEAQLAGVVAHEISHVALRHGTNQASKASLIQLPAILAGTVIGQESTLAQLGQLGLGLGLNSVLLKYSRDAELQADALGAKLMAGAGFNPIEMARFFEKLEAEGGARAPQFLSSHPNPGNRVQGVQAEIRTFPQQSYNANSGRFPEMKRQVAQLPPPRRPAQRAGSGLEPQAPSAGLRRLATNRFQLAYPDGWNVFGDGRSAVVTLAPREGLVRNASGGISIGYGAVVSYYRSQTGRGDLSAATQELVSQLGTINPGLRVGERRQVNVDGNPALITVLTGASPYGGRETNLLLTVARPEGLFYMVYVVPEGRFTQLGRAFDSIVESIQFPG